MEVLLKILLPILIQIESSNNDNAIGDGGKAVGCLQIHKIMVDDVNRILRKTYFFYKDRLSRKKSILMAEIYFKHYMKDSHKMSRIEAMVKMGRMFNGGPKGYKKKATIAYGEKVRDLIGSHVSLWLHDHCDPFD